jgi:hypothetical protein
MTDDSVSLSVVREIGIGLIGLTVLELQHLCNPPFEEPVIISPVPLQIIGNLANKPRNQITPKIVWEHAQ